jgi:hypothetical protein
MIAPDGAITRKRNILAVDHGNPGIYIIRFPADHFVRPTTHQITLTPVGAEARIVQIEGQGGNAIQVRVFNNQGQAADGAFLFAADRV